MGVHPIIRLVFAAALPLAMAGCVAPFGCVAPDEWEAAGRSDALSGRAAAYFDKRSARCRATADGAAYRRGHAAGLAVYCTEAHARRIGYQGHEYYNVRICPAEKRKRLEDAYHQGFVLREMQDDLRERRNLLIFRPVRPGL